MKMFKIYFIDNDYIEYLRKFDKKVAYNKNPNRPYVGIVYTYNNFNYFAPLSSPKPKHLNMKKGIIDIFKIKDGELGIINFNNMIPCPIESLKEAIPTITDQKYKKLLEKQLSYINSKKDIVLKKIYNFQTRFRNNNLPQNILERCCDFSLLEDMCNKYK